jgi:hypothetical protein
MTGRRMNDETLLTVFGEVERIWLTDLNQISQSVTW